ncbi:MAG: BatA domain-containing protein [Planctomyces sp.]|nr:BatA domain-containing protein [Planctomyces sp.]
MSFPAALAFRFAAPEMLAGLLLIAVPLLLHWLFRRPHREEPWGAMGILRRALERRSRRLRLETWLLLAVRMLMVAAAVLAFARPTRSLSTGVARNAAPTQRILIVDASLSMSSRERGASALEQARLAARRIVDAAGPGDAFRVLRIGPGAEPPAVIRLWSTDPAAVMAELERLPQTDGRGRPEAALEQALAWLDEAAPARPAETIVLSDFQESNWRPSGAAEMRIAELLQAIGRQSRLVLAPFGDRQVDNLALTELDVREPLVRRGQTATLAARIVRFGDPASGAIPVEARVNGVLAGVAQLESDAGGEAFVELPVRFDESGPIAVELALPEDLVPRDDRIRRVVQVRDRVRVLLVDPAGLSRDAARPSDYLRLALAPPGVADGPAGGLYELRTTTDASLLQADLAAHDIVVLCSVPRVTPTEAAALSRFVERGGGLIVGASRSIDAESFNQELLRDGAGPLPGRLVQWIEQPSQAEPLTFLPSTHSIAEPFLGNPDAGLETTRVWEHLRIDAGESPVLIALSNGDPALVEKPFGQGRCVVSGVAFDGAGTNWPVWPSFLPLVQELAAHLVAASDPAPVLAGEPLEFPFAGPGRFDLSLPDGTVQPRLAPPAETPRPVRIAETAVAGIYELRRVDAAPAAGAEGSRPADAAPPGVLRGAVNPDTSESRIERLDPVQLQSLLGRTPHRIDAAWQPAAVADIDPSSIVDDVSHWLFATLLLLAAVEAALVLRLGWGLAILAGTGAGVLTAALAGPIAGAIAGLAMAGGMTALPRIVGRRVWMR